MKNVLKKGKKRTKRAPDRKQPSERGKLPELCSTLLFVKPPCFPSLLGHAFSVPPAFSHSSPPTLVSRVAKWTTNGLASRALFSHGPPPPTQRTPVGPSGGAAPPARRVNRPRAAVGVVVPRGAAPALILSLVTRTVHAGGHAAAAGRQGTSGARGSLRSKFRTRFYSGRPLEPPARCALSSRDVPRRPNGECRAPQAPRSRDGFDSRMRYIYQQ